MAGEGAGPGLNRFCMDGPYISISPLACAPASPMAWTSRASDSPITSPAAAVAAKAPQAGVVWTARFRSAGLVARLRRFIVSPPATTPGAPAACLAGAGRAARGEVGWLR